VAGASVPAARFQTSGIERNARRRGISDDLVARELTCMEAEIRGEPRNKNPDLAGRLAAQNRQDGDRGDGHYEDDGAGHR